MHLQGKFQLLHDAVTALGSNIDGELRRISTAYNKRGLRETITSWDNAAPGLGSIDNQVKLVYDAFNQMTSDQQEHSGAAGGSTPAVTYAFTDGK